MYENISFELTELRKQLLDVAPQDSNSFEPSLEMKLKLSFKPSSNHLFDGKTVILLICYNRPNYLKRTLDSVIENLPQSSKENTDTITFVISQDGKNPAVNDIAQEYVKSLSQKGFNTMVRYIDTFKNQLKLKSVALDPSTIGERH